MCGRMHLASTTTGMKSAKVRLRAELTAESGEAEMTGGVAFSATPPRLSGTVGGPTGWGEFRVIGTARRGVVLVVGHPVTLPEPASQIDGAAAWTAERELRPRGPLARHLPL